MKTDTSLLSLLAFHTDTGSPLEVDQSQSGSVSPLCICDFHADSDVGNLRMIPTLKEQCEWGYTVRKKLCGVFGLIILL